MKAMLSLLFGFMLAFAGCASTPSSPPDPGGSVTSPSGFVAHYSRVDNNNGEEEGRITIEQQGELITIIDRARPHSFSPVDDILLVLEDFADDDTRQYLLNIGAGQYQREPPRASYVFGPRFIVEAEWSLDGQKLMLIDFDGNQTEFIVAEHL